jgi:SAM-dependent methyltransferase
MRTVVFERDVFEEEVKPHALLERYRQLLSEGVKSRLAIPDHQVSCSCVGCQSASSRLAFEKFGLEYLHCDDCNSVYVSPRPTEEVLVDFYRNSESSRFWRDEILTETREARRIKLFRPRAQWLLDIIDEYCSEAQQGLVVGYHNDLLIEELFRLEEELFRFVVANPIADIEFGNWSHSAVSIRPTPISELKKHGPTDLFLAFDILDRCADPDALFNAASSCLGPGGILVGSTTLISGFDLQVLWDRSESIYPPDRLNLLSVEGLSALFERHGFEALEFSTPGMFDVEIVRRAIIEDPEDNWPRFIKYLVERRDKSALQAFQEYLQKYRLSSFGRIVLRKTE